MKHTQLLILAFLLVLITSCKNEVYKEAIEIDTESYSLQLEANINVADVDRLRSEGDKQLKFTNCKLVDYIGYLKDKDPLFVSVQQRDKDKLMISGSYDNKKPNATLASTKEDFIKELATYLEASITETNLPDNAYYLVAHDSLQLSKYVSTATINQGSKTESSHEKIAVENASMSQIVDALNKTYGPKMIFLTQETDVSKKYTFTFEDIGGEALKNYLEKEIGLSIKQAKDVKNPMTITTITFTNP